MTRGRGSPSTVGAALVALALAAALLAAAPAAESFTTATYDRTEVIDVVADASGALALEKAATVQRGTNDSLVNLTNRVGRDLTVTVALVDPADGTLRVDTDGDGTYEVQGDTVTFALVDGTRQPVDVEATDNPNTLVPYDVSATAPGVGITAPNRSAEIVNGNGGSDPACDNPNPPPRCG